ncbi:uncharacterized protein LAJ45_03056 [Morchella importuna]|uniref:uncharacterized protein n=1 Tax=Morchella importuna TaxID=1174673 RepID=UPI001E8D4A9F|nr:uncharacterized protein LAJ45_03056 [Morchella importuna]KAH8152830.1 hypothetical protein LAJ45_03056 [Morchella importuna]
MPSVTRSATMEVAALPTPVLTEMPPVNFLKATKISLFDPMLIYLFRNHFSTWIDANNYGSQADFVELYAAFREVYKNHSKVDTSLDASREGKTLDFQALQALDDQNDLLLDQFWEFVMGMGQLAGCFDMSSGGLVEQNPEKSSKGKKEIRRYNHVLAKIVAATTDPANPGPWDIPKQARGKVPDAEGMTLEMFVAMKNNTDVLDYFDTKPYRDHWHSMTDKDFWHLSKHLNDLHQGRDFVEGFRYVDRYNSLVSLLKNCKGTIYFMSRPSTYEDVLLNPHMMELRFADNQKNNAKKKLDNRELAARRAQEFFIKHGVDPPSKSRALRGAAKGNKSKRAVSEIEDESMDEEETPAPEAETPSTNTRSAAKRRKATATASSSTAPKRSLGKGKGKAVATVGATSSQGVFVPPVSTHTLLRATTQVQPPPMVGVDPKRAKQLQSGKRQKQQYQHFKKLQQFNVQVEVSPEHFGEEFVAQEQLGMDNVDPRLRDAGHATVNTYPGLHNPHQANSSSSNSQFHGNNPELANMFMFGSEGELETQMWANNGQGGGPHDADLSMPGRSSYNKTPDQRFVQTILESEFVTTPDTIYTTGGQQNNLGNISAHHTSAHNTAEMSWHNPQPRYHTRPIDEDGNSYFDFEDASFGPDRMAVMERILDLDNIDNSDPDS